METSGDREDIAPDIWVPKDSLDVHKQEIPLEMALELQ